MFTIFTYIYKYKHFEFILLLYNKKDFSQNLWIKLKIIKFFIKYFKYF